MDNLRIARAKRVGITTPKNDKAHRQNGLGNQKLVATKYSIFHPKAFIQSCACLHGWQHRHALTTYFKAELNKGANDDYNH